MSIIECRDLTKRYGSLTAVNNINLDLEKGRIIGLLGPNGSGKTTFIKMANGLLKPTAGTITIDGNVPGVQTKSVIAYLPDREYLPDYMTVGKIKRLYSDFYFDFNEEKANAMLQSLNIPENMSIRKMSKGTKEKLQLIMVMARDAKVYFLDEPIGGVDPAARDYILRTIISNYNPEAAVVISTHLIADVESVLDDVVFIQNGNIVLHKGADELRAESGKSVDGVFREVFRC
mgnify:CR=1 FL=1|jgi:ABC-type multidrug transport system, ATPase component